MAEDQTTAPAPTDSAADPGEQKSVAAEPVFLVSYPKVVFFYPSVLAALFGAVFMWAKGNAASADYALLPARVLKRVMHY